MRLNNRAWDELRDIKLEPNVNKYAEGSCLVSFGDTQVLCLATVEDKLPSWLKGSGKGWITAEYGMLPRSTEIRMDREAVKGNQNGRTQEIQRLVARSLRAAVDLRFIPDIGIKVDCDVIQADGGTRTAAVTGGFAAMHLALQNMKRMGLIKKIPLLTTVSAVSCGIVNGQPLLDLDYNEDCNAETDANFCITGKGTLVEVQATAEKGSYTRETMDKLLDLAYKGTEQIAQLQREVLGLKEAGRQQGENVPPAAVLPASEAEAEDEAETWAEPAALALNPEREERAAEAAQRVAEKAARKAEKKAKRLEEKERTLAAILPSAQKKELDASGLPEEIDPALLAQSGEN